MAKTRDQDKGYKGMTDTVALGIQADTNLSISGSDRLSQCTGHALSSQWAMHMWVVQYGLSKRPQIVQGRLASSATAASAAPATSAASAASAASLFLLQPPAAST